MFINIKFVIDELFGEIPISGIGIKFAIMLKAGQSKESAIGTGRHGSVTSLLDAFHSAAAQADLATYFGCFALEGRFLGTDASENWSAHEFFDFCRPHFASGQGWTYKPLPNSRKFSYFPSSDAGNQDNSAFCTFDELLVNDSFGTCRGSGSCVYDAVCKCWFIAAFHLSFPVPNDIAHEITKQIKLSDVGQKQMQADAAAAELLAELELEEASDVGKSGSNGGTKKKKKGKK